MHENKELEIINVRYSNMGENRSEYSIVKSITKLTLDVFVLKVTDPFRSERDAYEMKADDMAILKSTNIIF